MGDTSEKKPCFDEGLGFVYTHPWEERNLSICLSELMGEKVIAPRFTIEDLVCVESIKHNPLYKHIDSFDYKKYSDGVLVAVINPILEIKDGGLSREFPGVMKMNGICNAYHCNYTIYYPDLMGMTS